MTTTRKKLGFYAEQKAREHLQSKGLVLIEQNYSIHCGEIDLIMQDQEDIVFVEVRSRQYTHYGSALESINQRKINKLIKTAVYFLQSKKWLYKKNSRFDVVTIHAQSQLEWIKNAFTMDNHW